MRKNCLKTKLIALSLSVVTAVSVGMTAVTSANAVEFHSEFPVADAVLNAEYQCGLGLIRQFVPGGQAIAGVVDSLLGSIIGKDKGPSLSDISKDLNDFRKEVSKEFKKVKEELKGIQNRIAASEEAVRKDIEQQARLIEQQITARTVIAAKGAGFDELMTALMETDRQIRIISDDKTLSDQEKSVEIAMLIGRNDKWNSAGSLYNNYMNFINALTSATFSSTGDHDIFYYIYLSNIPYAAFSNDAKEFSRPYVDRLMQLGVYTYSIIAECLEAAHRVAGFSAEDIAKLSGDELAHYHEIKTLKSIVESTFSDLNQKVFDTADPDSVASHLKSFNELNGRVFIKNGTVNIPLKASVIMDGKNHRYGNEYGFTETIDIEGGKRILNDLQNSSPLSFDDNQYIANYVKSMYPGRTLADYLIATGFEQDWLRDIHFRESSLYLMTGNAYTSYHGNYFRLFYPGINVHSSDISSQTVSSSKTVGKFGQYGFTERDFVLFFCLDNG